MPKTKISEFSATPANNTDIDSINIAEGCAPSGINDAIRELMAQLKDFQTGAQGDSFNGPIGSTTPAAGAFTTLSASGTATLSGLTASTALALDASKNVVSVTNTGTGSNVLATSPTLVTPILGTPTSATLTNATGLPISTGVSGLGTGVATFLATPSSANLASALTDETGTGSAVFATSPTLVTPALGSPSSVGTMPAFTLGGTVSGGGNQINNVIIGTSTPLAGAFTTVTASTPIGTASGGTGLGGATPFTANGVVFASSSSVLATGSGLVFDGTNLGIGTSSPTFTNGKGIAILDGTTSRLKLATTASGSGATDGFELSCNGSEAYIYNYENSFMAFGTNATERLRLDSAGNLGIGTSSPSQKLDVSGGNARISSGSSTADLLMVDTGTTSGNVRLRSQSNSMLFVTGGGVSGTLDSAGNLGLGVTPSAWDSAFKAFQLNTTGCIASTSNRTFVGQNWYDAASGGKHLADGFALRYDQIGSNGSHAWYTSTSGTAGNAISFTQAMTLDASGNLGIGTTSPDVFANGFAKNLGVAVTGSGATASINVSGGSGGAGRIQFGTEANRYGLIYVDASNFMQIGTTTSLPISFITNNTERARIDSSGNFFVDCTDYPNGSTRRGFEVLANSGVNDTTKIAIGTTTTSTRALVELNNGNGNVGSISVTGSATSYNTSSDYRLKDNQQPLTGSGSFIDALQPKTWSWKADGSKGVGFIAHEAQAVSPSSVIGEKDAIDEEGKPIMQAMEYGSAEFIANIIAELQSLRQRLAVLEAK